MEEKDWIFLRDKLCPSTGICTDERTHIKIVRKKLDDLITRLIIILYNISYFQFVTYADWSTVLYGHIKKVDQFWSFWIDISSFQKS
jgi:hypothetical protein